MLILLNKVQSSHQKLVAIKEIQLSILKENTEAIQKTNRASCLKMDNLK